MADEPVPTRRPKDDPFRQQKMRMWQPIMTPTKVVALFIAIGICFVPAGMSLLSQSNALFQSMLTYDGANPSPGINSCSITKQNAGAKCKVTFTLDQDVKGPLYVYYQLDNFYQNHRKYVTSRSASQLEGVVDIDEKTLDTSCLPLTQVTVNGKTTTLSPCGLIANSFFTDIITLNPAVSGPTYTLNSKGISWPTDANKFIQPTGFKYEADLILSDYNNKSYSGNLGKCGPTFPNGCKYYRSGNGTLYRYYYPSDDKVTYLYETYPLQISPIEGVTNEHFMVWMRTAALPNFRKLYGKIESTSDFLKGTKLAFMINNNFEVLSFGGSKSIVISTIGPLGGQNPYLGVAYIVVGSLALLFGVLFGLKQIVSPRPVGDPSLLPWH